MAEKCTKLKLAEIGSVPASWSVGPLGALLKRITYGFTNPMPATNDGPFMVTAKDIRGGRIDFSTARHTSEHAYRAELTNKSRPNKGDILLTKDGSIGRVAICDRDDVCINQSVALLQTTSDVYPQFLKYLLETPHYQGRMEADSDGSTIKHIYITRVDKMQVATPPIAEQRAIVSVLGALDNKIDTNRRMNETLETMARAMFEDWFVDFGPTRAKMEGRPPYLSPEIWALFPHRLDDEGRPNGWFSRPLDQIASFLNGLALQKYPPTGQAYLPVIKIAELRAETTRGSDKASVEVPAAYVVENGDVLFSWSGSLLHRVWSGGRGALNQHLFKVSSSQFPKWFYYHWVGHYMESFRAIAASKATTMGHIQRHHLAEASTVVPDDPVLMEADALIAPLFERRLANDLEAQTIASVRDLLLPKLMSGEVRVRDAATLAEGML